jgi:hypothetical protein
MQLGEQQRADMELRNELAARDHAHELRRRHQLHADARLRIELAGARAGLDEE